MDSYLRIEAASSEHSTTGLVSLDPEFMKKQAVAPGDVVEITSTFGKTVLGRVATPLEQDSGQAVVRMDHYQRQSLKAVIGDIVEVEKTTVPPAEKVALAPLRDITFMTGLEEYLVKTFSALSMPVNRRSILYTTFPGGSLGAPFRVVSVSPDKGGVITADTKIEVRKIFPTWPGRLTEITFEDVGGLRREVQLVRELVELPLRFPDAFRQLGINPPRGVILQGPAGSGKTLLMRALANELEAQFLYVEGPSIIGTQYGETETNLRHIFEDARQHVPTIIFVDELDVIGPKRGESGTMTDTRMSTQFLELLDGLKNTEGIMVIGSTNRVDDVDPALRRPGRFDREIFIGPPDKNGRLEILRIHTRGMPLAQDALQHLPEIARSTHGFVGADLMELCREAGLNALRRQIGVRWSSLERIDITLSELIVTKEDFVQAVFRLRPSALRETVAGIPDVRWADVGGIPEVKERMRDLVEKPLLNPDFFSSTGLKPPTGVLLYGPPGTGKTLIAKALANECNANFVSVRGSEVYSKWVGESEQSVRDIFKLARQVAPTIIFFDQLDAIAPRRIAGDTGSRTMERVVAQLLSELDGIEPLRGITVLGATNRIDLLDPAVLRPGRFGVHVYVPLPDEAGREDILRILLGKVPMAHDVSIDMVVKVVAPRTAEFSGAELEVFCQEARLLAMRGASPDRPLALSMDHFVKALDNVTAYRASYNQNPGPVLNAG